MNGALMRRRAVGDNFVRQKFRKSVKDTTRKSWSLLNFAAAERQVSKSACNPEQHFHEGRSYDVYS